MDRSNGARETRWGAVGLGWVVAVLAGIVISSVLRLLYGFLAEPPIERGEFTAAVLVVPGPIPAVRPAPSGAPTSAPTPAPTCP